MQEQLPIGEFGAIRQWLAQFPVCDRPHALRLVESLTLVKSLQVKSFLERRLFERAGTSDRPVACFIVRDTGNARSGHTPYFPEYRSYNWRIRRPIAVVPRDRAKRHRVNSFGGVGSEALVSSWLTQWARRMDDTILDQPTFDEMADHRCRDVIFLDDIVASGRRASEFLAKAAYHPTFKSWRSGASIRFHYICYAASTSGLKAMRRACRFVEVQFASQPALGRLLWSQHEHTQIERVCRDAAARVNIKAMKQFATGFEDSMATMIFEHSCPNNTPAVLWFEHPKWRPLFRNRAVGSDLPLVPLEERWRVDIPDGILRLNWRDANGHLDLSRDDGRKALRALVGLAKSARLRDLERLTEYVGVDIPTLNPKGA